MTSTPDGHYPTARSNPGDEKSAIYHLASQCRQRFESLSRQMESPIDMQHHLSIINHSQGRFSVWANNIGALRDPKSTSSLDYRLRDGMQMRKSVTKALVDIKESAERAKAIAAGELPNRDNQSFEPFMNASAADPSPRAFQFDPLLPNTHSPVDEPVTTELDELLASIQASVDRLFRLSMLIRRSRPRGRQSTETGALGVDPSMDIRHVEDKFPKVKEAEWLAERLGMAIAKRRAFICYRQLHHQRLTEQSQDLAEDSKARSRRAPSTIATTYEEGSINIEQHAAKLLEPSIITEAKSFATAFGADENGDLRVPDLTRLEFHGIQLKYFSTFDCPFCRTIQTVSSEREWRRHVFTDLQPYICTLEGCSSGSFSSRHEWFNHEIESHRKQWRCAKCHSSKFTSASSLRDHFDSVHPGSFTNSQWPLILKTCERPLRNFGPSSCPLCFSWDLPEGKAYNAEEFCRHLGSHLQQLALTALPIAIEGLVVLDDGDVEETDDSDVPDPSLGPHVLAVGIREVVTDEKTNTFEFIVKARFKNEEFWRLRREYQDFYDLHVSLLDTKLLQKADSLGQTLPYMPGPVGNVTMSISEGRLKHLDTYLSYLVRQPAHISRSKLVRNFFKPRVADRRATTNYYDE
ncbi:PX domain-containing protein [Fusarium sp. Ph1]|nr:PX domain-containing protein [Fusarium sp. Ph1]